MTKTDDEKEKAQDEADAKAAAQAKADAKKETPIVDSVPDGYVAHFASDPKKKGKGRSPQEAIDNIGKAPARPPTPAAPTRPGGR